MLIVFRDKVIINRKYAYFKGYFLIIKYVQNYTDYLKMINIRRKEKEYNSFSFYLFFIKEIM